MFENKLSVITGNIFLLKKKHADCPEIMDRLGTDGTGLQEHC